MSPGPRGATRSRHTSGALAVSYLNVFAESVDDAIVRGDKIRRLQSSRSTSRQYHCFSVPTNDSDLLDLGFIDRKDPLVIFEKDDGLGSDLSQERDIFFALVGAFLSIAVQDLPSIISPHRNPGSRTRTHLWRLLGALLDYLEDLQRSFFDSSDGHLPRVDGSFGKIQGPPLVGTGHFEVNSGVNSSVETVCSEPVAHEHPVESPLLTDDVLEHVWALCHVGAVEAVVAVVRE